MAKVLIVTGRLAEAVVREAVARSNTKHFVEIVVAPVDVAAFLTTKYVAKFLSEIGVKKGDYDYIMIPGLAKGCGKDVEEVLGIKTVKGCINAYDLTELLKLEDLSILSEDKPADEILHNIIMARNKKLLIELENSISSSSLLIGKLRIPLTPPPIRIASEIPFTHTLNETNLYNKISYLIENGADIISLGFEALEPHPDAVYKVVRFVKKEFDVVVAVDTAISSEIVKGIEAGCDMITNIDLNNIEIVARNSKDVAIVIVPRDPYTNSIPLNISQRVELLSKTLNYAKTIGIDKILADAVLDPPGSIFNSMLAYHIFKSQHPEIPMFMGIGNVTELMDVDSVGVNALLVELAQEISVSVVLTSECSDKTYGSTRETKIAAQMTTLAKAMNTIPKNLGLSLLILKDKKRNNIRLTNYQEIITVSEKETNYSLDPVGIFKINVNHDEGYIEALYIGRKGRILIKGKTAKTIRDEILSRELVSMLSHAMYLGGELTKAEEALRIGKNYVQDCPLFSLPKPYKFKENT